MQASKTIKLINFLVSLRKLPPLSELSGDEERLLFALYALWEMQGSLSISDVYDIHGEKSSSTAYRHLMSLKKKGLVLVEIDGADKRKRHVKFTKYAEQLFTALT